MATHYLWRWEILNFIRNEFEMEHVLAKGLQKYSKDQMLKIKQHNFAQRMVF